MINKVNQAKEFVGMDKVNRSKETGNPHFMGGRTSKGGHKLYKVIRKF